MSTLNDLEKFEYNSIIAKGGVDERTDEEQRRFEELYYKQFPEQKKEADRLFRIRNEIKANNPAISFAEQTSEYLLQITNPSDNKKRVDNIEVYKLFQKDHPNSKIIKNHIDEELDNWDR